MAKMALADGTIADEERAFLQPFLGEGDTVDGLLDEAKDKDVPALASGLNVYADKFFVALRAASMAHIDDELHAAEEKLYQELCAAFGITDDDKAIIDQSVQDLAAVEPQPLHPRLEQLYQESSFA